MSQSLADSRDVGILADMLLFVPAAILMLGTASPQDPTQQGPPGGFQGGQRNQQGAQPGGQQGARQGRTGQPASAEAATGSSTAPMIEIPPSTTHHSINLPSGSVSYSAIAAQVPLRNDTGEVECRMFCVSYLKDGADVHTRPGTFAFNGGPGRAPMWRQLGALGP